MIIQAKKIIKLVDADTLPMCSFSERDEVFENIMYEYTLLDMYKVFNIDDNIGDVIEIVCEGKHIAYAYRYVFFCHNKICYDFDSVKKLTTPMITKIMINGKEVSHDEVYSLIKAGYTPEYIHTENSEYLNYEPHPDDYIILPLHIANERLKSNEYQYYE